MIQFKCFDCLSKRPIIDIITKDSYITHKYTNYSNFNDTSINHIGK